MSISIQRYCLKPKKCIKTTCFEWNCSAKCDISMQYMQYMHLIAFVKLLLLRTSYCNRCGKRDAIQRQRKWVFFRDSHFRSYFPRISDGPVLYGTDRPGAGGEHIWASNESLCALSVGADVLCDTVNQTAGSMKIPPTTPRALCQQVGLARFWFFALFCSFWPAGEKPNQTNQL